MGDSKDRRFSKRMLDWVFYSAPGSSFLPYWPRLDPCSHTFLPFLTGSQRAELMNHDPSPSRKSDNPASGSHLTV